MPVGVQETVEEIKRSMREEAEANKKVPARSTEASKREVRGKQIKLGKIVQALREHEL